MYLSFYHRQTITGCMALISRDDSNTSLNVFASHHMWRSLALLPDLRYLIVGLTDVDAVEVLVGMHRVLWDSLGEQLRHLQFASQPTSSRYDPRWVGHDPVSLNHTGLFVLFS